MTRLSKQRLSEGTSMSGVATGADKGKCNGSMYKMLLGFIAGLLVHHSLPDEISKIDTVNRRKIMLCDDTAISATSSERQSGEASNDNSLLDYFDFRHFYTSGMSSKSRSAPASFKTFTELLIESGSDKYDRHHYEFYYQNWLNPFRSKNDLTMLEIGARDGKSMAIWDTYFVGDNAHVIGLAYGDHTENVTQKTSSMSKIQIIFGDQSKKDTMDGLINAGPYDIIIDDGSHVPQHVVFSLFSLWDKAVKPGGLYVIEDLETNYWSSGSYVYGYRLNLTGIGVSPEFSAVSKIEQIQNVLHRHQIGARDFSIMPGDHDICSIEWGMNLVALRKCPIGIKKPPVQRKRFNKAQWNKWKFDAIQSNPRVD